MARNMYGATSADFTLTSGGRVVPGSVLTIWSARTGGTQITDLTDVAGTAITSVTSGADGSVVYYGPDADKDTHWAQASQGSRIAIRPVNITGETGATPALTVGTVGTGTAAASLTGTSEAPVLNLVLPSAGANGVNTAAIQDGAVTSAKIADGTIATGDIADQAVTAAKIANDTITAAQIAANAVGASELADGAVDTAALQDSAVTAAKIAAEAVTSAKLAKGLTLSAVTPDAVFSGDLAPAIGSWSAVGGASFSAGTWTVPAGDGVSCTISSVTAGAIYQVDVSQAAGAALTVTLGGVTQVFAAWQNSVTVVAAGSGSQTLTVTMASAGSITGVTVRSVTTLASPVTVGAAQLRLRSYNNAIGVSAQRYLTTGSNNNAIGVNAQYSLTTGSYNTALGQSAGSNITVQSGTVCIGVDYSGTAAQASADNDFVLGTGLHKVLIPGSLETTGNDKGVIVRSPNGTRWRLGVSNAGAVTVVAA